MSDMGFPGAARGVRAMLRLEGAVLSALAVALYVRSGASWPLFAALFLLPDLAFAGYLAGPRIGAVAYNALHSTIGPLLLAAGAQMLAPSLYPVALIWLAHIGVDRALGYGLKYASGFGETHLGPIGKARSAWRAASV